MMVEWQRHSLCVLLGIEDEHAGYSTVTYSAVFTSYSLYRSFYIWCALFFMSRDSMVLWYKRSPSVYKVHQLVLYILMDFAFGSFLSCFQALYRDIILWARARAYECDVSDLKRAVHIMRTLRFR